MHIHPIPKKKQHPQWALIVPFVCSVLLCYTLLPAQAAPPYLEVGGRVVIEGEHFAARTANADGHHWHVVPDEDSYPDDYPNFVFSNARGGFVMMLPDSGSSHASSTTWNTDPTIDYTFHIETTGTYQLYLRWRGWDGGSDSLYAQMLGKSDGIGGTINDWYNFNGGSSGNFNGSWRGTALPEGTGTGGSTPATWDITAPGDYTIRITYREDGCAVDTICFQLQTLAAPTDPGPPESPVLSDTPFVWSRTPGVNAANVFPLTSYSVQIHDGAVQALSSQDPVFSLNGTPLSFTKTRSGAITTLSAASPGQLAMNSVNTLALVYQDAANASYTNTWQFSVGPWADLPASFAVPAAQISTDPTNSGFVVNLHEVRAYDTNGLPITTSLANSSDRAEGQLRGYLLDPATGLPYTNNFSPGTGVLYGDGYDELFYPETYLNWNISPIAFGGSADAGNFQTDFTAPNSGYPDVLPPGFSTRADPGFTNNFAYEIMTYLDLPAGLTRFGVNSDDGFRVTSGLNSRDRYDSSKVILLGAFEGGRGSADTLFDVMVPQAGIYPVRLLWYQGGGGANLEFFVVQPDGTKILINDIASGTRPGTNVTIKAYRWANLPPQNAVVDWLNPAPDALNVPTNAVVQVQLGDSAGATVVQSSIQLLLNGQPVSPSISNAPPQTLLTYAPSPALVEGSTNIAQVEFTDSLGASITQSWQFVVAQAPTVVAGGEVTRKIWEGFPSGQTTVAQLTAWPDFQQNVNYNTNGEPTVLTAFEQPQFNPALDNYGEQFLGYIVPEVTADYSFYLGSDDSSELWLSTNSSPANQVLIAYQPGYNGFREYLTGRNPYTRRSAPLHLEAGQRYFFQALHKEGTGGDNFSVAWWRAGDPPITNGSPSISGTVLQKFVGAAFVLQPLSRTVRKGLPVSLSAQAIIGTGAVSYQWLKGGTPVSGANSLTYDIPSVDLPDAGQYLLRITVDGVNYDSSVATLTVIDDNTPPTVLSAIGLNDTNLAALFSPGAYTIGVEFSEPIDTNLALTTATIDVSGNTINARAIGSTNNVLLLQMATPVPASFTVTLGGITDAAGNALPNGTVVSGSLSTIQPAILGTAGTDPSDYFNMAAYSFNTHSFQVRANGSDIWNSADAGHFLWTTWSGDFDASVRVESLTMANTWSKSGIMAREDLAPGSRNVMVLSTPTDGQNVYNVQWRDVADAGCASKATAERIYGMTYPDVWLRLTRQGDTFTAYIKTNGVDWLQYHSYVAPSNYPPQIYVGMATTSHDNTYGAIATATYRDWSIQPLASAPPSLGFVNQSTNLVLTWTQGILLEASSLTGPWTTNTTAASPFTITPTEPQKFYRLLVP